MKIPLDFDAPSTATLFTRKDTWGIAELYVMDERFTAYCDKHLPGCARFLRDAAVHWVK